MAPWSDFNPAMQVLWGEVPSAVGKNSCRVICTVKDIAKPATSA